MAFVPLIAGCVRAKFQTRASSRTPAKMPAAAPVDVSALPSAACWMLSKRGVGLPLKVRAVSRLPSRYRRQVLPS